MVNRALAYEQAQLVFKKQLRKLMQFKPKNAHNTNKVSAEKHEGKDCPHKDKICSFCKIKGHIVIACRKKKQKEKDDAANMVEEECQNAQIEYCSRTASPTPPLYL